MQRRPCCLGTNTLGLSPASPSWFVVKMTPGRWFAVIIAIFIAFIALSVLNFRVFQNHERQLVPMTIAEMRKLEAEPKSLVLEQKREAYAIMYWLIGREVVLIVVAIGGVWTLYYSNKRRRFDASRGSAQ